MKKLMPVYAVVLSIFFILPALCLSADAKYTAPKYRNLEMALMLHYFDYKEDIPAPNKSTESGWLPGLYVGWELGKRNNLYMKFFMEISNGDLTYDGTTQSGEPIRFSKDNNQFLFRGEFNFGFNYSVSQKVSIIPYTGLGYRYWERGEDRGINYRELYDWLYLPIGVKVGIDLGRVTIEPNIGIRAMFAGTMTAYFSDFDCRYSDPEFDLGNDVGCYAEIPVRIKLSPSWSLMFKPWYEHSRIGRSDYVSVYYAGHYDGTYYEPSSKTNQYGFNFGAVFSY